MADSTTTLVPSLELVTPGPEEADLAAVAFLARYGGRTLDAYRHDLRSFFQWTANHGVAALAATRAHIELYRMSMEQRSLAASTIDRRLSTVCGYYRFAHIDGRIPANPAQYVRRPKVTKTQGHGMDRTELGTFLFTAERYDPMHSALAVLLGLNGLRVSEACGASIENLAVHRGHRTLAIVGKGNRPAVIPLVPRTARTLDLAIGDGTKGRSCAAGTASASTVAPLTGGFVRSGGAPDSVRSIRTCSGPGSSWPPSMLGCRCVMSSSLPATPTHAPPRSTTGGARTSIATPPTSWSPSSPGDSTPARHFWDVRQPSASVVLMPEYVTDMLHIMAEISPFGIRRAAFIHATPERIWEEFTTYERMKAWYGTGHELTRYEPRVGGVIETSIGEEPTYVRGEVLVFEPCCELTFDQRWIGPDWTGREWIAPAKVTILLTPAAGGTIVELFHHGYDLIGGDPAEYISGFESGWDTHHLDALAAIVAA